MKKKYKLIYILLILIFIQKQNVFGQQDLTIHWMRSIPQSNFWNPAIIPDSKLHWGSPGLSSVYLNFNLGFTFNDVVQHRSGKDENGVSWDSTKIDPRPIFAKSFNSFELQEQILFFGMKIQKTYINFNVSQNSVFKFIIPDGYYNLLTIGNMGGVTNGHNDLNLGGLNLTINNYTEISLGIAREINKKLVVGIRPKVFFGTACLYFKKSDLIFRTYNDSTSAYKMRIFSDLDVRSSIPTKVNEISVSNSMKNNGYGIDIGAFYTLNKRFQFSASVIDLFSHIRYKTYLNNFISPKTAVRDTGFVFEGLELEKFFNQKKGAGENAQMLADSLQNIFVPEKDDSTAFTVPFSTKIMVSGLYSLRPTDKIGLLIKDEIFAGKSNMTFCFSYNKRFGRMFSASATYSYIANTLKLKVSNNNIGGGFSANLGNMQFYLISDNFIFLTLSPLNTKNLNLHFGFNWTFNREKNSEYEKRIIRRKAIEDDDDDDDLIEIRKEETK